MLDVQEMYKQKLKTPEQIAEYFESGFVCAAPTCVAQPIIIAKAVGEKVRREDIWGIQHHSLLTFPAAYVEEDIAEKYAHVSWFSGPNSRKGVQKGLYDVMPCHLGQIPRIWEEEMHKVDVFYAMVSPMDRHGYFSVGVSAVEVLAQLKMARYVFLEVNDRMPRTYGTNIVHISQVTALCECSYDLPELPSPPISDDDMIIGQTIAELIPDGATLQLGIGGIPDAVGKCMTNKKDLGLHTEMFCESMIDLIESGVVNNSKKNIDRGITMCAFALGTKRMYDFLDENPSVQFRGGEYVNDPYVIGKFDNFVSVNSCVEVDFWGQVCSESVGPKNISGTGGQVDFVRGCYLSPGGKSFIAMNSTVKGGTVSKIKPMLTPGAVVTTLKTDVEYIVTEYGAARLRGKTLRQRTRELISIAHPKFREELTFEARKMNILI
ncbi:MAG: acetyl-CoA hydrolase/transferase C-terminal domain-containing protein [Lachnospiraceae bacterium]|nr:acetyl-CoA hydrolase/transferase C-terminal domain-containing protein [Lachnospiraceae bacterium]